MLVQTICREEGVRQMDVEQTEIEERWISGPKLRRVGGAGAILLACAVLLCLAVACSRPSAASKHPRSSTGRTAGSVTPAASTATSQKVKKSKTSAAVHTRTLAETHGKNRTREKTAAKKGGTSATTAKPGTTARTTATEQKAGTTGGNTASAAGYQVSAVGDSVMLGAAPDLRQDIPGLTDVDAVVSLQVEPAIGILQQLRAEGRLGQVVIVHLGNNGTFTPEEFDEIMQVLSGAQKVVFVNDEVPRPWEASNNAVISEGVARYPGKAVLVDWHAASEGHPEYFYGDGVHLTPEGAQVYSRLIAAKVNT